MPKLQICPAVPGARKSAKRRIAGETARSFVGWTTTKTHFLEHGTDVSMLTTFQKASVETVDEGDACGRRRGRATQCM